MQHKQDFKTVVSPRNIADLQHIKNLQTLHFGADDRRRRTADHRLDGAPILLRPHRCGAMGAHAALQLPLSVKAIDADGKVIGLLNMSDYRIQDEVPQIATDAPDLLARLNARRYTAVFSFIVAEPYRGTQLNYNMLMSIMPELKARYDFIFIPVLHRLKTHQYWQRWGATEFYRDAECVCYKLELQAIPQP